MTTLLGLSGSLRSGSLNTALLHAATDLAPEGVQVDARTLHGVPLFNEDDERAHGAPPAVAALKDALAAADGLLMVTPEYNTGIPGVFKNALDWMSRQPGGMKLFAGKPVAILGASPGGFGTLAAQDAWQPVLRALGVKPWWGTRLFVSRAHTLFDDKGQLTDEVTRERLSDFMANFAKFVQKG